MSENYSYVVNMEQSDSRPKLQSFVITGLSEQPNQSFMRFISLVSMVDMYHCMLEDLDFESVYFNISESFNGYSYEVDDVVYILDNFNQITNDQLEKLVAVAGEIGYSILDIHYLCANLYRMIKETEGFNTLGIFRLFYKLVTTKTESGEHEWKPEFLKELLQAYEEDITFESYLDGEVSNHSWVLSSIEAKEKHLHDFLNVELSLGILTKINEKAIELNYEGNSILIDKYSTITTVSRELDCFIDQIEERSHTQ